MWTAEPVVPPFPGMNLGGGGGNPSMDQALRVSAVWACVRLLAQTVSMMPLHAFTLREGIRVPIADPPLLVQPSDDASMPDWIYMVMVSLLLRGNAYGKIIRWDSMGYPVQIELLNPDMVQTRTDPATGKTLYSTRGGPLDAKELWHVRAFRVPGSPLGLSPIQYAAQSINTDTAAGAFGLGYLSDAPHPPSVLESDQSVNQEQAKTILSRFLTKKPHEPLVLGVGLKYRTLSVSPEESQFLATQKFGLGQIARVFGCPPEMIGGDAGNSMTYSSREQRAMDFLTYGVQWWLTCLEAAFAPTMPGHRHARFDTSVLTRVDFETLIKSGAIAIASKQRTPDEVRALGDLPPLTEEQKKWLEIIPLTISPSGLPKGLPATPAPRPAVDLLPVDSTEPAQ
jgi:HK97 family phage portal protein